MKLISAVVVLTAFQFLLEKDAMNDFSMDTSTIVEFIFVLGKIPKLKQAFQSPQISMETKGFPFFVYRILDCYSHFYPLFLFPH